MNPNTLLLPHVWPRAEATTVNRCLLLALLAHVWLVLTLGNAPGGTAQPGVGVWGAVNVTLRGPEAPGGTAAPPPSEPAVATGPAGVAITPRWGGAVRAQPAPDLPAEAGTAQLGRWAPLPAPAAADPALDPLVRAPAAAQGPALPAGPLPEPGRVLEERAVAPVERSVSAQIAPAAVAEAPALPAAPPAALPIAVAAPAALPSAVVAPTAPALRSLAAAPPPVAPLPQAAALPQSAPAPAVPAALAAPAMAPALAAVSPVPAGLGGGAPAGAVDAGTRLGHDVAGAPALPASAPPRLNLQLARPRGGEISRGQGGGMLAVLPRPPEVGEKLGEQIAKTAKPDCRQAYAGAGLLAVVPLAVEALRKDSGCKW